VADLDAPNLKPANWDVHATPQTVKHAVDMRIYELHVRDFSIQDKSVPSALRGKYLAFTQKQSHGMRHLKALAQAGMTDLHLLPVFDFATVPEQNCRSSLNAKQALSPEARAQDCFNWGYDPLHFNAPEGSYASKANDGAKRIVEFRRMVKALHEAGWRVGMDMVYNHTSASGQHVHSVLDRIVPGYYQRLNAQGEVERSTCCDNTATEHLMMGKLMSDSMLMWTQHYKLDSFRFDLMGHQPRQVMVDIQQRLQQATGRRIDFVGEGWNFGEVANGARFVQASQLSLNGTGIGTFNDRLRDAIRGGGASDAVENLVKVPGFISGQESSMRVAEQIRAGLAGSLRTYRMVAADGSVKALQDIPYGDQPTGYASAPSEVVNYAENHDNLTLFDSLIYKLPPDLPSGERARVQNLASALTAFSQGVAYFHAGMDILRSKSLDGNKARPVPIN
jgi:pullulanase-type alpha-1,6-glucosidase